MNLVKAKPYFDSLDRLTKTERYAVLDAVNSLEKGELEGLVCHGPTGTDPWVKVRGGALEFVI